ncbi:MAG: SurA N-terminal domain-containing protein [Bacteroidales bacterium]|nr:SurA N-terminal domain-containing protein [Bacteroidales bacterium]
MATLQKIRNKGPLIAIVIGIALLAFLLGDVNKIFSSGNDMSIAEINGTEVSLQEYQARYNNYEQGLKLLTGQTSLTTENQKYVESQVWDKIVKNYALSDTYEELGIDVSGMELAKIISGENIQNGLDPLTRQVFSDQNGNFNAQNAVNFFSNASETEDGAGVARFLEEEMKDNRKYTKYMSLISKGINITGFEAKQLYRERTELVDFDYAVKRYNTVADSTINVSDTELEAYYKEHKEEYEQEHTRDIAYITFNVVPSEEDKKVTREELEYYKNEFAEISIDSTQEELINYVNANSETKFSYPHLSFEELNDSALFYASSDTVFGLVFENGAYTMKRVFDRVNTPDSIEARHILIQVDGQVIKDIDRAKEIADSLMTLIKSGSDFAQIAKDNSAYQVSAQKGGDLGMFTEDMILNQLGLEFSDEVFKSKVGELKIIETGYGVHITEITGLGGDKKERVRLAVVSQIVRPGNNTVSDAFSTARDFSVNSDNNIEKFDELVEKNGYIKRILNDVNYETEVIAGIENPSSIINWIFKDDTEKESVSQAFQDGDMFIVAIVTEIREEGIAPLEQIKDEITAKVVKEKKAEQFVKEMTGETNLVKTAKNISFSSARLNDDGIEYKVIATAVYSEKDKVTNPIIGENGVYVLKVVSKTGIENLDEIDVTNDKLNSQRRIDFRISREAFEAIKEAAELTDNRYKFI